MNEFMLASSFEGLYSFLWSCIGGAFLCGFVGAGLIKTNYRKLGFGLAFIGLSGAGFLLFDALRYHQRGQEYLLALTFAVVGNLAVILWASFFRKFFKRERSRVLIFSLR